MKIEREYYPLNQAAEVLGCTLDDLVHLGATGKIPVFLMTTGIPAILLENISGGHSQPSEKAFLRDLVRVWPGTLQVFEKGEEFTETNALKAENNPQAESLRQYHLDSSIKISRQDLFIKADDLQEFVRASADTNNPEEDNPHEKVKRAMLLKMLIGMARERYKYDPTLSKNDATSLCIDPVKSCSSVNLEGVTREYGHGRRNQTLDG